ncbi:MULTISPECIES: hypothetical protein [unclassified Streptomyces]|uniref:hypothetical protein n=1 Tax=unclassified Streptomyces TaxID=2593676 RepID=UPI001BE85886|nr:MULTISPECIES: hypothetical protein [unclassified Streptomyces]MBT2377411.1 hypothetical protein [Streptomyces sp. ISL-111]MBT2425416.1 hypothetical protein [Streptomyces sp. ISL-112]
MTQNTPLSPLSPLFPRPLHHVQGVTHRVLSAAQLRARGVSAAQTSSQCLPGGPWQHLLPGVYLLHPGPPSGQERLRGALLYAGRPPASSLRTAPEPMDAGFGEAMVTGQAALALHGFAAAPDLGAPHRIDVLVPRTRRLRSTRFVEVVRAASALPAPVWLAGVPVAPVERALADAVAGLGEAEDVSRLLTEAVRAGHSEPGAVVRELSAAKLLGRPAVVGAVEALLAAGRAVAEERLYAMVREHGLPEPLWNVDLRLPDGPELGGVDAYWPDLAVAVELDTRAPRFGAPSQGRRDGNHGNRGPDRLEDPQWSAYAAKRDRLERLGVTVVHLTPRKLREAVEQQATVVRTALMAADDREPAAYVVVLPR